MGRPQAVLQVVVRVRPRAVARVRRRVAAAEAEEAAAARPRRPPAPCQELPMVIQILAVFGTSRTLPRRVSKGLTRLPAVVAEAVVALAVAAGLVAAAPLARVALPVEALRWRHSRVLMAPLPLVARRVARVDRAVAPLALAPQAADEPAVAEADGFSIRQTEKSPTLQKREQNSRTSS